MITKTILEQIEGEASLYFDMKGNIVDFVTIAFPHFRGMEKMLEGKNAMDALVITPRVCGICGHSHLLASVRAIEDAYKNSDSVVEITNKAAKVREITLVLEIIQNHLKWIYLVLVPHLKELSESEELLNTPLKGAYGASLATKILAIFAGQWPHSSYMVPGGITSDFTYVDLTKAKSHLQKLTEYFEAETLGVSVEEFLSFESCKDFAPLESDFAKIEQLLIDLEMHKKGHAKDTFLSLGIHEFSHAAKVKGTKLFKVASKYVETQDAYAPDEKSYAKNALYKNQFYETGPLARCMAKEFKLIKNMHRRFKDSAYTRVMARIYETAYLLGFCKKLLDEVDVSEKSCVESAALKNISAKGEGVVEAPRGPLIHRVEIEGGIIKSYEIITPTQYNIASATKENPSPAQQAMLHCSQADAKFIFRTFDVCSVCTTH
ncbi:nickel-dependent hydrogenase large subunit [Sulfurimonas sp. NW15]|uniref:nickel-dependent hydrogenase large subunit n=1 Tax=Sulfurimonas sp. NW15 TaxID=2922729 RepID=UPI003DA931FA